MAELLNFKSKDQSLMPSIGINQFEDMVIKASLSKPVLVDFWAPWCGPCKQLMPLLEKAVADTNGAILAVKVNIDEEPHLASALRIQSVPTVFAFYQGKPVDGFMGAQSPSQLKEFITKILSLTGEGEPSLADIIAEIETLALDDLPSALLAAEDLARDAINEPKAQSLYLSLLLKNDDLEKAQNFFAALPEHIRTHDDLKAVSAALKLKAAQKTDKADLTAFEKTLAQDPLQHEARFALASALFLDGAHDDAIDHLLFIIKQNPKWDDGKARAQLLTFFDSLGFEHPAAIAGRRKLSAVLFA
jgi:putative thioredoxin